MRGNKAKKVKSFLKKSLIFRTLSDILTKRELSINSIL